MLSYAQGPDAELLESTIPQVLAETASRFADRPALVSRHQGVRWTYAEFAGAVERLAAGLIGLGLKPGDRAGVWASNGVEWVLLQFATARAGIVLVNVNPAYRAHELRYILGKSGMRALFLREQDEHANYREILAEARADGGEMALKHAVVMGSQAWNELVETANALPAPPDDPHAVVNIQYTSGTTGNPKGVLLTHRNLVNNALLVGRKIGWSEHDSLCLPVPLYHCFGCVMGSLGCVVAGAKLVLPAAQFDAAATLEAIHAERCTSVYGVPTMFLAELEHPRFATFDLSCLRTGIMAGAPCPVELMKRVTGDMHCPEITIAYGQTEASPVITQSARDDEIDVRVGTVGRAMPATEVKIADPESGETVALGEQGELCTRGYLVMSGYDGDPDATARAVDADGWLHTGDLARMRDDGNFRITGRAKDMILRGGENIYPREIEEYLHTHPSIADVHVVGLPDERLGERVLAWIRLTDGEDLTADDVRTFCKDEIAYFKIPEFIRFIDAFPMTVTGKVQKFKIRDEEVRLRGLEAVAGAETA